MATLHPVRSWLGKTDWFVALGVLALAGYGFLLAAKSTSAAAGSDSSGYLNIARMLGSGRLETPLRLPPGVTVTDIIERFHFQPLGFHAYEETPEPRMVPTYSVGVPLQQMLATKLFGWNWGVRFVAIVNALFAVWLCFAMGRELGLGRSLAGAAAVAFAACPLTLFAAIQPLSDGPSATWCLASVWTALRARQSREWAVAAGAAFGVAVLVRPTNVLLLPALLVVLGFDAKRLACWGLGGVPAAAWLAYYNQRLFGGPFSSGYINWQGFFATEYVPPAAQFFARWLAVFVPALLLLTPLAALACRDLRNRGLAMLALWFAGLISLYLFCAFSHEAWNSLRYILPAVPALILAGCLGIEALARRCPVARARQIRIAAACVVAAWAIVASGQFVTKHGVFWTKHYEDAYTAAAFAAQSQFEKQTLVLGCYTSGSLYFYTALPILRYDAVTPAQFAHYVAKVRRGGGAVGALIFPAEEARLRELCPGEWTQLASVEGIQLWRLASP